MITKEDKMLSGLIEDRILQCDAHYMLTISPFLDFQQRTLTDSLCRGHKDLRYAFYGGFADADRCIAVFLPDYTKFSMEVGEPDDILRYFADNQEDNPLSVVRAQVSLGGRQLTHRDYLGSLMGLGLKREMIGDILVLENSADIVILKEIEDFLLYNYEKAGKTNLKLLTVPVGEINVPESRVELRSDTVASLRLDNLIASAFGLSRSKADEAIKTGLVFLNGRQMTKPDLQVKEGDKLVLRGKGKTVLKTVGGQTRKDRVYITIERYL